MRKGETGHEGKKKLNFVTYCHCELLKTCTTPTWRQSFGSSINIRKRGGSFKFNLLIRSFVDEAAFGEQPGIIFNRWLVTLGENAASPLSPAVFNLLVASIFHPLRLSSFIRPARAILFALTNEERFKASLKKLGGQFRELQSKKSGGVKESYSLLVEKKGSLLEVSSEIFDTRGGRSEIRLYNVVRYCDKVFVSRHGCPA